MTTVALRTALIWHDEVMSDVVAQKPAAITLGVRCVRRFPWLRALTTLAADVVVIGLWVASHEAIEQSAIAVMAVAVVLANVVAWSGITTKWKQSGQPTFVVPDVGLPERFTIVRPGNRGYLLTLGERMRGTICLEGQERDVAEFVRKRDDGDGPGGFRATPIAGRDWGVIDLDESGRCKLFFQFVPHEEAPIFFTPKVIAAGVAGFLIAGKILTLMWWWKDYSYAEAAFRGFGLVLIALTIGGLAWWLYLQDGEQKASFVFSIALHGAVLFATIQLYNGEDPFVWPGPRALTGNYLVTRLEVTPPPEPPKVSPTVGQVNKEEPAAANPNPLNLKTATKGEEGAMGGKGEKERARDPNARDVPPDPPKVAFFEDKNRKYLDNIIDRNLSTNLGKFTGIKGDTLTKGSIGFGPGTGTGVGDGVGTGTTRGSKGKGSGGGGNVEGDFVTNKGKIDMGKERPGGTCVGAGCQGAGPREVKVAVGEMSGDPGGLTAEEINRVVKARAGVFRACYQKELNRSPGLGGKLVIRFKIDGQGVVQAASPGGGSSLSNEAVTSCVTSNVMRLKFPAKGGAANVTYPFVFSQGG